MIDDEEIKADLNQVIDNSSPIDVLLVLAEVLKERDLPGEAALVEQAANL